MTAPYRLADGKVVDVETSREVAELLAAYERQDASERRRKRRHNEISIEAIIEQCAWEPIAGLSGAFLAGGISSLAGKFVADSASSLMFGTNNFGTWEDYAIAFVMGGLLKGSGAFKTAQFLVDVFARPFANQLAKIGTRGIEFNVQNYFYTVAIRAITFNIGFGKFAMSMFGSEFSVSFGKSIIRGFLSGFGKRFLF